MNKMILFLFVCICSLPVYSQEVKVEQINNYLDVLGKNNQDMGKIVISQKGKVVYSATFGPEGVVSYGYDSLKYRIGSISKMLTGILAFRLQEQGVLQLEETIDKYYPAVPNAGKITISHLLSHTSGLKDIVVKNDTIYTWLLEPVSQEEIVAEIIRQGIQFEPGDSTRYSNSGYYLLANILEKKSGKTYQQLLKSEILDPLGLTHTIAAAPNGPDIAFSYIYNRENKKWEENKDFYFPNIVGVGDVASTCMDLTAIINGLFTGKLLTPASLEQMKPDAGQGFGKGLMAASFYEKKFYGHSGGTYGSYAKVFYNEQDQLSVAVTVNGQVMVVDAILVDLFRIIYDRDFSMPRFSQQNNESFDPEELHLFEGTYGADNFPLKLRVFRQGDELYFQGTGQPAFPIERVGKMEFARNEIKVEVEFVPEEGIMKFSQLGQKWTLNKEE